MKRLTLSFFSLIGLLLLTSCNCGTPIKIKSIQQGDKNLTCKDVILEINESEFFRKEAAIAQRITLEEAFTPTCWLSTYMSGSEAARAANERIQYLSQLYDILDCGGRKNQQPAAAVPPAGYLPMPGGATQSSAPPDKWMHMHADEQGNRYMHSHENSGAHNH
jgi:hypothetical protein